MLFSVQFISAPALAARPKRLLLHQGVFERTRRRITRHAVQILFRSRLEEKCGANVLRRGATLPTISAGILFHGIPLSIRFKFR